MAASEEDRLFFKYREGLSFQVARKIVIRRIVLSHSYATAAKDKQANAPQLQDA